MNDSKSAVGSLTIVSAATVFFVQLAQLLGYSISADDQTALLHIVNNGVIVGTTVVSMVGTASAIYGRVRAKHQIVSVLPKTKNP